MTDFIKFVAWFPELTKSRLSRLCTIIAFTFLVTACTGDKGSIYLERFSSAQALAKSPNYSEAWSSGFEQGFPGEWFSKYKNGYTPENQPVPSEKSAIWSIVNGEDNPGAIEGKKVYKGWIRSPQAEKHRAYPVIHTDIVTPLINVFWVWLDLDYDRMDSREWVHLATWSNNPDWQVHTMSVRDRFLRIAHLNSDYIGPLPRKDFPLRQWVRLTSYIHYYGDEGYIRIWQNGVPMLEGIYTNRTGSKLMRAHWGMYASSGMDHGVQYNDDIRIWTIDAPLQDLLNEPLPVSYPFASPRN